MFKRDPSKRGKTVPPGVWLPFGVAIGCALGVVMGNLALGVGLGVAGGGVIMFLSRRRNDSQGS